MNKTKYRKKERTNERADLEGRKEEGRKKWRAKERKAKFFFF